MEKIYRYKLVLGIIIMLAGILSAALHMFETSLSLFLINMGLILFVITAFRLFRQGAFRTGTREQKNWQLTG